MAKKTYDKTLNVKLEHNHDSSDILNFDTISKESDSTVLYGGRANTVYPTNQVIYGGNASTDYHGVLPILGGGAEW